MALFDQHNRQIDLHARKGAHAIELGRRLGCGQLWRSGEVPIMIDVVGFAQELKTNGATADSACGKFFAADDDRFMRHAMAIQMTHEI